jgi:two-component system nitrogen regulation response regulator NtrX
MKARRILVVDDEPGIRQSLSGVLEDEGYAVEAAGTGEDCLSAVPGGGYELLLLDIWLPGMDGMEVLARIQEIPFSERPLVVMISGHGAGGIRVPGEAAFHRQGFGYGEERTGTPQPRN